MNPLIDQHLEEIRALCREYGVTRLELFGSICTPEFDSLRSDIDFIVEYPPGYDFGPWLKRFFDLQDTLSALIGRNVDLVIASAMRNRWVLREAAKTRTLIYDLANASPVTRRNQPCISVQSPADSLGAAPNQLHPKSPKWLHDIADASAHIMQWTAGCTFADYEADRRLQDAVERNIGIVGMALIGLERTDPAAAGRLSNYQTIVDVRDRLQYRYDDTDHHEVWQVIHDLLPLLRVDVDQLLLKAGP